ncbi:MAG: PspA/IM30 family protein [Planctomycetota bacterium]
MTTTTSLPPWAACLARLGIWAFRALVVFASLAGIAYLVHHASGIFRWQGIAFIAAAGLAWLAILLHHLVSGRDLEYLVALLLIGCLASLGLGESEIMVEWVVPAFDIIFVLLLLAMLVLYAVSGWGRGRLLLVALTCIVLGWVFGTLNVGVLDRYRGRTEPLPSQESQQLQAARERVAAAEAAYAQFEQRLEALPAEASEFDDEERIELAITDEEDQREALAALKEKREALAALQELLDAQQTDVSENWGQSDPDAARAYRAHGKQERAPVEGAEAEGGIELDQTAAPEPVEEDEADADSWALSQQDLVRVTELEHASVFLMRLLLYLGGSVALLAYIAQFNATFPSLYPLPLSGRWVDGLSDKEACIHLQSDDPACLRFFLELSVRKGESFVLFTDAPVVRAESFARVPGWLARIGGWLGQDERVTVAHASNADPVFIPDSGYVFETAWTGRGVYSIIGDAPARTHLVDLLELMRLRRPPFATARRTLNLVWYRRELPPPKMLDEILYLARNENLRVVLVGAWRLPEELESRLDAVYPPEFFAAARGRQS